MSEQAMSEHGTSEHGTSEHGMSERATSERESSEHAMSDHPMPERARGGRWVTIACLIAVVALLVGSWLLAPRPTEGEAFSGTDATVTAQLEESGVEPWFQPFFAPGSGEIESGLFALQAAVGGGLFGYAVGRLHGRRRG